MIMPVGDAVASTGAAPLQPSSGQFVPVTPVHVLDTRDGTGGVPVAPLEAGATATFSVTGIGQIPADGVSDVYVVLNAIGPTSNGCLADLDPDQAATGICSATFDAGSNVTDSDIVGVDSSGDISVTNSSSGTVDVVVTVMGYFTDGSQTSAGDTYVPLPLDQIVETQAGLGAPQAQIPAGGTLTVQVTGLDGVPADAAGAALYIGAKYASTTGDVSAYPTGGSPSTVSLLSYVPSAAVHDLYFGSLSASGQLTLKNNGSGPVDMMVAIQGYLVSPAGSEVGSIYQDVQQYRLADTRSGTGGVQSTPVQPGASITFAATGVDNIPQSGVAAVAETVVAISPSAVGFLSEYAAGAADPAQPGINFYTGGNQGNGLTASLVSSVSPTGEQTITNHSTGTVNIAVTVRGYYVAATTPTAPVSVQATVSGSTAAISWTPPNGDGGTPITNYIVTAPPDTENVTVSGSTSQVTLTGLTTPSADTFTVVAVNAIGQSTAGTYGSTDQVLSGTLLAPAAPGTPNPQVPGDEVLIYDLPQGQLTGSPQTLIGSATTDSSGNWTFALPPFASLPAAAQADAQANGGMLNVEVDAYGTAGGYLESASVFESAWVGTGTGSPPSSLSDPTSESMILTPPGPDNSAQDTTQNQEATFAAQNDPDVTDGPVDASASAPVDTYGYQAIGPDNNYNPYVAPNGVDLTDVTPQAFAMSKHPACTEWETGWTGSKFTTIGEVHDSASSTGDFAYTTGSKTSIDAEVSYDSGAHWGVNGGTTWTDGTDGADTWDAIGPNDSRRALLEFNYAEERKNYSTCDGYPAFYKEWIWSTGLTQSSTSPTYKWGKSGYLNSTDTETTYCNMNHPRYRYPFGAGTGHTWEKETGWTWNVGASVLGVAVGTETDYTTITTLHYHADKSTSYKHWTWGNKGNPISGGPGGGSYGGWPEIVHALDWDTETEGTLCGFS